MKRFIWRFVTGESGDIDGLTIFTLTVGFIAAFVLLNGTVGQLFATVFGMIPVN